MIKNSNRSIGRKISSAIDDSKRRNLSDKKNSINNYKTISNNVNLSPEKMMNEISI
jgi:hypothetical protein